MQSASHSVSEGCFNSADIRKHMQHWLCVCGGGGEEGGGGVLKSLSHHLVHANDLYFINRWNGKK